MHKGKKYKGFKKNNAMIKENNTTPTPHIFK